MSQRKELIKERVNRKKGKTKPCKISNRDWEIEQCWKEENQVNSFMS